MDDGGVESGIDRFGEEHRVEDVSGGGGETEGHVRHAEHRPHARQFGLDPPDRLQRLEAVAAQVVVAGGQGEREGVDEEVRRILSLKHTSS